MRLIGIFVALAAATFAGLPSSEVSVFRSYAPLELKLEAPFTRLVANIHHDPDYSVTGSLTYTDGAGRTVVLNDVSISGRGHTSLREDECEFPKLKLKFTKATNLRGSLFENARTVKIGTHCGDQPDNELSAKYGRLANEKSPIREAFVYRLLEAAGVPSLKSRPAKITYVDPSSPTIVRSAMLLEDDDDAVRRFGANGQLTEDTFGSARERLSPDAGVKLAFAEALIGNFDWCVRWYPGDKYRCDDRHPLWNVLALTRPAGVVPLIYDFDLSGHVVGRHIWFHQIFGSVFDPSASQATIEVLSQLQRTRSVFSRAELDAGRRWFAERRSAMYNTLADADIDDAGRQNARAYMDAFFTMIGDDQQFYRPVVAADAARISMDAAGATPACGNGHIPDGTPVSAPLETTGMMMRVNVLDALWYWTSPRRCDAVHNGPVWLPRAAVSTDYPRQTQ